MPSSEDQELSQNSRSCFGWYGLAEEAANFSRCHPKSAMTVARECMPGSKGLEDLSGDILESPAKDSGDLYSHALGDMMGWQTPTVCHHSSENITSHLFLECAFDIWKG